MNPDSLRLDERYSVELLKTKAVADRRPFDELYPHDPIRCNSKGEKVLVVINGQEYSRRELLEVASGTYACMSFAS